MSADGTECARMTFQEFLTSYGYAALFVGVLLEGETILVLAGFAAHRGYLSLPAVIGLASAATLAGDQLIFTFGRWRGKPFVQKHAALERKLRKATALLDKHHALFIVGRRFLYGLRTVSSLALGMSGVPLARFVPLNALGALMWAGTVATLGYLFGAAFVALLGNVEHIEKEIIVGILVAGAAFWLVRIVMAKVRTRA
jgi:membrane protein DedA with SNARE-associated domain